MSALGALEILNFVANVTGNVAQWANLGWEWATANQSSGVDAKVVAICISNHTTNQMYQGAYQPYDQGQALSDLPATIDPGQTVGFVFSNRPGVAEDAAGVITYYTFCPTSNDTSKNPNVAISVFFANPYSGSEGQTRFNVQPDYNVQDVFALWGGRRDWIDNGATAASNSWVDPDTWAESWGGSQYWVHAYMSNMNPCKLEVHIHGRGDNDRADMAPNPGDPHWH
jgi:hypothetical protein